MPQKSALSEMARAVRLPWVTSSAVPKIAMMAQMTWDRPGSFLSVMENHARMRIGIRYWMMVAVGALLHSMATK